MSKVHWRCVVAGGALWTVVYNFLWDAAWFAFMRREWTVAAAAVGRPMPFTAEIWFVCVVMSLAIGMAIVAYAAGRARPARDALCASLPLWLLMTVGMTSGAGRNRFPGA